jgi:hypothetical protein
MVFLKTSPAGPWLLGLRGPMWLLALPFVGSVAILAVCNRSREQSLFEEFV